MKNIFFITIALFLGILIGVIIIYFYFPYVPAEIYINLPNSDQKYVLSYDKPFEFYHPDFANKVRQQLIASETSFMEANLSNEKLRVYDQGEIIKEVPIIAKGKRGSWWETPSGLYRVETKMANHFSSITRVYMPWSIHFYGNFFIHGWPYLPSGQPLTSETSGGCIRLTTPDAKEIYNLSSIGMPILIYRESEEEREKVEYIYQPKIEANAFLVADLDNNFIFYEKNRKEKYELYDLVNLLVGVISFEYINLTTSFIVSEEMLIDSIRPRLKAGQKISVYNLLFPLLMESSAEARKTLSLLRGEELFLNRLNDKAVSLGMNNTKFFGGGEEVDLNTSTPEDLFVLAKYIKNNRSLIYEISSLEKIDDNFTSFYGQPIWDDLVNLNYLSGNKDFLGGLSIKVNDEKESALLVFNLDIGDMSREIVLIILASDDLDGDVNRIKKALVNSFSIK